MSLHLSVLALLAFAGGLSAQEGSDRPRVFFDCNGPNCNSQYYRTEIGWVSWVNDRAVADVHVIMGSVSAGAGGREYQLDFLDVVSGDEGYEEQLVYTSLSTDTQRESLDGITHTLGIGLATWANTNGYRGLVTLQGPDTELDLAQQRVVSQDEVDDPWNLWVFRFNGSGNRNSEATRTSTSFNGSFSASRVTPTWKINFMTFTNHNRRRETLFDGSDFRDVRTDWMFGQLTAYSVAEHWSIGLQGRAGKQTSQNQNLQVAVSPSIEYSFFPYDEATRRSLTAFYSIGPQYSDYLEETLRLKTDELLFQHSIAVEFSSRQAWGDAGFTLRASHYLQDISLNSRSIRGDINYRITRGVSVNARGSITWVQDQIYLANRASTDAERLLRLQRQATDRESRLSVGFSIQFGSIFNNVVNNRFSGAGGFPGGGGNFRGGGGGGFRGPF